jgi:hypothetical protein
MTNTYARSFGTVFTGAMLLATVASGCGGTDAVTAVPPPDVVESKAVTGEPSGLPTRVDNYTICCPKYVTVEQLVAEADSVVVARLSSITVRLWDAPDMGPNDPDGKAQKIRIDGLNFVVREVLAGDHISELQLPRATYVTDASGKELAVIERHGSTIEDYKIDSEYVFVLRGSGSKYGALEAGTFAVETGGKLRGCSDNLFW